MKLQIQVIRFVLALSMLFAIGTYFVTLNIEMGFMCLSSPWISNNFLLTVVGGAFASMLVVLLCEIQKYHELKKEMEDKIFLSASNICLQSVTLIKYINHFLANPSNIVPKDILSFSTESIKKSADELVQAEYCTFFQNSKFEKEYSDFCQKTLIAIQEYTIHEKYLSIAINTDQINYINQYGEEGMITSSAPLTNQILNKYKVILDSIVTETWDYLKRMDECCKERFGFINGKRAEKYGGKTIHFMSFEEFMQ